jgi:transcription initiation factor TFIID subunit 1, fungi type
MPHATADETMADLDENALTAQFLAEYAGDYSGQNIDDGHAFDQTDKADNAMDFEDISDDDLPDEEEATNHAQDDRDTDERNGVYAAVAEQLGGLPVQSPQTNGYPVDHEHKEQPGSDLFGESDEAHDLFGEHSSSPEQHQPCTSHSSASWWPGVT